MREDHWGKAPNGRHLSVTRTGFGSDRRGLAIVFDRRPGNKRWGYHHLADGSDRAQAERV